MKSDRKIFLEKSRAPVSAIESGTRVATTIITSTATETTARTTAMAQAT